MSATPAPSCRRSPTRLELEPEPADRAARRRAARDAAAAPRADRAPARAARAGQPARPGGVRGGARARRGARGPARPTSSRRCASCEKLIADIDRQIKRDVRADVRGDRDGTSRSWRAQLFPGGKGRLRLVTERDGRRRRRARRPAAGERRGDGEATDDADAAGGAEAAERGPARGRDRDHAGRQGPQAAVAAVGRREVDDRARVPVRGVPGAAVPVLHPRRGRGGARRPQHHPLPGAAARILERAQFIVVTHQKRTMEAADSLYGVSMGSDGISKVISRRLPAEDAPRSGAPPLATPPRSANVARPGARLAGHLHRRRRSGGAGGGPGGRRRSGGGALPPAAREPAQDPPGAAARSRRRCSRTSTTRPGSGWRRR